MSTVSKEFEEYILNDLKKYAGLIRPQKAKLIERILVRKARPVNLHPNPEDEFCDPKIGPNYGIVGKYVQYYVRRKGKAGAPRMEPLMVEKITPRGYMILNGHHRWLAARRVNSRLLPIRIVNVTTEEEIQEVLSRSENAVCASMDLDEVVLAKGASPKESRPWYAPGFLIRERVREGVPALISELQRMGCDVWVYAGGYYSTAYVNTLLKMYRVKVNGVVNGLRDKNRARHLREEFRKKYVSSIHCDLESVTCVRTGTKEYDLTELTGSEGAWAAETIKAVRGMESVKK